MSIIEYSRQEMLSMGVIEQRDKYDKESHNAMIQQHIELLHNRGYEVFEILRIKKMFWLWGENYTKIYYRPKECK